MAIGRTTWVSLLAQAERRSGCSLRDLPEVPFRDCILTAGAGRCNRFGADIRRRMGGTAGSGGKCRDVAGAIGLGSDASRHYRDAGPGSDAKRRPSERPLFIF